MFDTFLKSIFGSSNDRLLKTMHPTVQRINELEPKFAELSDEDLKRYTYVFKERIDQGEPLDDILPEAFAVVKEAAGRVLGMRHYDVQLIGGMVLHSGQIAEMKTGEGKTLVATLPIYLNALEGKGAHVVTVNDYLARRDAEWMGQVYKFLGMNVGVVYSGIQEEEKRQAYHADITYGQNNEFGFDYLRDNLKFSIDRLIQRGHHFAVVDEVDSILIDEARTPLIISGPAEDSSALYAKVNKITPKLREDVDYEIDLKTKQSTLTEEGMAHAEKLLGVENLYDPSQIEILHHVNQSLRAHVVMQSDIDYVVRGGEVLIVDEYTGRLMPGRRWSDGLHQAIEAKEKVKINRENRTLASITFQNLFRQYDKLSGMTGTAVTEAAEFKTIYNLDVVVIPTNLPLARIDYPDTIFRTMKEKYEAVVEEIEHAHEAQQPVLVGTTNIEQSELLSAELKKTSIAHSVLNAKNHAQEATIVAQAGRLGAVTIATNMAGRGTDIVLGGNPEFLAKKEVKETDPSYPEVLARWESECHQEKDQVLEAGGLYILGTERHESRRIDNQLRGRAGRQGDPGASRFFISLEDNIMKRFGGDRYMETMKRLGWRENVAIDSKMISRTIENAQARVERFHFESRKTVTDYDDVLNKQRQAIYSLRWRILEGLVLKEEINNFIDDLLEDSVVTVCDEHLKPGQWDLDQISERFKFLFNTELVWPEEDSQNLRSDQQAIFDYVREQAKNLYHSHREEQQAILESARADNLDQAISFSLSEEGNAFDFEFATIEQETLLEILDQNWNKHLQQMDYLREGVGLRGYAQKNPLHEYQHEGFDLFTVMLDKLKEEVLRKLFYFDAEQLQALIKQIQEEHRRRAEIQKQMEAAGQAQEDDSSSVETYQPKDPEEQKAKLKERRKARRRK